MKHFYYSTNLIVLLSYNCHIVLLSNNISIIYSHLCPRHRTSVSGARIYYSFERAQSGVAGLRTIVVLSLGCPFVPCDSLGSLIISSTLWASSWGPIHHTTQQGPRIFKADGLTWLWGPQWLEETDRLFYGLQYLGSSTWQWPGDLLISPGLF